MNDNANTNSSAQALGFSSTTDLLAFNTRVIKEFRENEGRCGGPFEGNPMLLLTMTGAKSGRSLTTPLSYCADGDDCIVFASSGGSPKHPNWYFNLKANAAVEIERGTERYEAGALCLEGQERQAAYELMVTAMPRFADYQAKVDREIPIFRLQRSK